MTVCLVAFLLLALLAATSALKNEAPALATAGRELWSTPTQAPSPYGGWKNNTMCHLPKNMGSCVNCVAAGCVFCQASPSSCYSGKPGEGTCYGGTSYQASGLSTGAIQSLCDGTLMKTAQTVAIVSSIISFLCCCACVAGIWYYFRMVRLRQQQTTWGQTYVTTAPPFGTTGQPGVAVYPGGAGDIIPSPGGGSQQQPYPTYYPGNYPGNVQPLPVYPQQPGYYPQQQQQQPQPQAYPVYAQPYPLQQQQQPGPGFAQPYPQPYPQPQPPPQPQQHPADFNFEAQGEPTRPTATAPAPGPGPGPVYAHAEPVKDH